MILAVIVFILLNLIFIEIVEARKVLLIINIILGVAILFYFIFIFRTFIFHHYSIYFPDTELAQLRIIKN